MDIPVSVAVAMCLLALGALASFFVSPSASTPEPVEFDRTVSMGLTLEQQLALEDRFFPRAEVFYSQYQYVVGYMGLGLAADAVDDRFVRRQFGYPRVAYVELAPGNVTLDDDGYLVGNQTGRWIDARDAHFVVDTGARTPAGPTPVAFGNASRASAFADAHGGRVLEWGDREQFEYASDDGTSARQRVAGQQARADETVRRARPMLDRPTGVVAGRDAPTLQAALDRAESNTTVRLPPGVYDGPVVVNESVSLVGENATVVGDGNGTVVTVRADDVALAGLAIEGVGDTLTADTDGGDWDERGEQAYGTSDAGVRVDGGDRVLVTDTTVETPASGFVFRDSNRSVVDGVTVEGTDDWRDGFMGVVAMRSPLVVQHSTFEGGRDAVYAHRARGLTVRDNRFRAGRFGVHLMYTSDALAADNCAVGQDIAGLVIMTSPSGTAFTGNVVADADYGILTSGRDAYVGENVVVRTGQAIETSARNSLYAGNALVGNDVGFRASDIFPTSVVVDNDVVDNHRHVRATTGPLRVWSEDGRGNYWSGAAGLDRPYSPTDPVDGRLHRTGAARTLSAAPSVVGLRTLRGTTPGMRTGSVVDAAPRDSPVNATRLQRARTLATDLDGAEVCAG